MHHTNISESDINTVDTAVVMFPSDSHIRGVAAQF